MEVYNLPVDITGALLYPNVKQGDSRIDCSREAFLHGLIAIRITWLRSRAGHVDEQRSSGTGLIKASFFFFALRDESGEKVLCCCLLRTEPLGQRVPKVRITSLL